MIDVLHREHHGWFEFEHVAMGSINAEHNELFFHSCDDVLGFAGSLFSSIAILHQIDEHAEASHVSDDAVFLFELHQLIEQTVTYSDGVVHRLLFLDDVKDGVADGATYMITSVLKCFQKY